MDSKYTKTILVAPSRCDSRSLLSYAHTFSVFQDIAGEHAERLGIGLKDLMKNGLFWLTVKTKVRYYKRPFMLSPVTLSTWPEKPDRVRANRDYVISSEGETLIEGKTEWAVLSIDSGRPQPLTGVYPSALEFSEQAVLPEPFLRIDPDFSCAEDFGEYTVRSTDVDLGMHMNNSAYVHALFGLFSLKELNGMDIYEVEVAFRSPAFEGQTIRYKKRISNGYIDISGCVEDKNVFLARITLR